LDQCTRQPLAGRAAAGVQELADHQLAPNHWYERWSGCPYEVSYIEQLTAFGDGNFSEGIRLLAETAYTSTGEFWLRESGAAASSTPTKMFPQPTT
jgi:hypothetical protein